VTKPVVDPAPPATAPAIPAKGLTAPPPIVAKPKPAKATAKTINPQPAAQALVAAPPPCPEPIVVVQPAIPPAQAAVATPRNATAPKSAGQRRAKAEVLPETNPRPGQPSPASAIQAPQAPAVAALPPARSARIADELARRLPLLFDRTSAPVATSPGFPAIPAILLEGDRPGVSAKAPAPLSPVLATPGGSDTPPRFVPPLPDELNEVTTDSEANPEAQTESGHVEQPPQPAVAAPPPEVSFPQSGSLWLTARDPFYVVVHWQIPAGELAAYARAQQGGSWQLRVHLDSVAGPLVQEQALPEHADHRFVPVFQPGARYVAELGFRFADGGWRGLALSSPTFTPPDAPAEVFAEAKVRRAPAGPVTPDLLAQLPPDHPEPAPAPNYAAMAPRADSPAGQPVSLPTPRQAQWLTELVWEPVAKPATVPSSAEVAEWQSREVSRMVPREEIVVPAPALPSSSEGTLAQPGAVDSSVPASEEVPAVPAPPSSFWFKVNAELILYGSTERDARVTIAGRPVALRSDGSFSFRFALPDGDFTLPAIAVNAAGTDRRAAHLRFTRATVLTGEVRVHLT
jgi:hypothetical protein